MEKIRTFVAISISDEARFAIASMIEELREIENTIRWVDAANLHLTSKFIGEIEEDRIEKLRMALDQSSNGILEFRYSLSSKGCFPNWKRPRVLWIGVHDQDGKMSELQQQIEDNFHKVKIPREKRKFKPHLTIGRVKQNRKPGRILNDFQQSQLGEFEVKVNDVHLMQSELLPTGAKYSVLHTASLQTSNSESINQL